MHRGLTSWRNLVVYAFNAFSIPLLADTLFSPWRMDRNAGAHATLVEKFVFSLFSRFLGLIARVFLISIGVIVTAAAILTFPAFFFLPIEISKEFLANCGSIGATLSYGDTFTLNAHSRDVADAGAQKIYGKEKALRMIERGLSKESMRNVLLVGEAGVGKTSLISHLGRMGQSGLSFPGIRHHRMVEISLQEINPAVFEKCLNEAAAAGNVILVIENIHNYTPLYEKLLPYLDMRHLGVVATTDLENYDQVLKNYPEFLAKWSKVDVAPTDAADTVVILVDHARAKRISINEEAIKEIVRLAERLIGNQYEPAKSLSILEELAGLGRRVTIGEVRQIVSDRTNIPVGDIGTDERKILAGLEGTMKNKIVGQDEAVVDVVEAMKRLRTGVASHDKPAGSFLFLGPTGVGKTYTAKILAESYFGRKNAMIRFDMSEFSLAESITAFTDRVAAAIEEAPLSLVFLDELEKSHSNIRNLLLQVLDEGRLTRANGREASFKDAIVIATSNAGSVDIMANPNIDKKVLINNLIQKGIFAPEFLNRWNSIVLFKPLDQSEARQVAGLLLVEFAERLWADKKIKLVIDDALIEKVAAAGFDPQFGARPIKRAVEDIVENKVAEYIMAGNSGGELKIV
jgi:ATP-dependent Clp protease ATP-binding subunit ClpC